MNKLGLIYIFLLSWVLFSCSPKQEIEKADKLPGKSTKYIQSKIQENDFDFNSLSAKFSTRTFFNDEKLSFKGSLRIKKDSIIWFSMTKLGGVEVLRVIFTQDSIKLINKWDKEYMLSSIDKLSEIQNVDLGYNELQDLLIGKMIDYDEAEKYQSSNDNVNYILSSRNKGRIRRASTIVEGDSLMEIEVQDKRLQKSLDKKPDLDYILKTYYLDPESFLLDRQTITLLDQQQAFDVVYSDYQQLNEDAMFSFEQVIRIATPDKLGRIDLNYSQVQLNNSLTFPFKISSKYVPVKKDK